VNRDVQHLVNEVPDRWSLSFTGPTGDLDHALDSILARVVESDEGLVSAINDALHRRQRALIYCYAIRLLARGLTDSDAEILPRAATALAIACYDETDYRDLMVNLAPLHVVATRLTGDASSTLDWIVDRLSEEQRNNLRRWGRRTDVTLDSFGWKETATDDGIKLARC
jgi:hypothetical protein